MLKNVIVIVALYGSLAFYCEARIEHVPEYHTQLIAEVTAINPVVGSLLNDDFHSAVHYNVTDFAEEIQNISESIQRFGDEDGVRAGLLNDFISEMHKRIGYVVNELFPAINALQDVSEQDKKNCIDLIVLTINESIRKANEYTSQPIAYIAAD